MVTRFSQKALQGVLTTVGQPEDCLQHLVEINDQLRRVGEESAVASFAKLLDDSDPARRRYGALGITMVAAERPEVNEDTELIRRADEVFTIALERGSDRAALEVSWLLAFAGVAPKGCLGVLRRASVHGGSLALRVFCAAALSTFELDTTTIATLNAGVNDSNICVASSAACALARRGIRSSVSVDRLAAGVRETAGFDSYYALLALKELGSSASAAIPSIAEAICDSRRTVGLRAFAATVIGLVAAGTDAADNALIDAFDSDETPIARAAVEGFRLCERWPPRLVQRVRNYIVHDDPAIRELGLSAAAKCGPLSANLIGELAHCMRQSLDDSSRTMLIEALTNAGPQVVPMLVEAFGEQRPESLMTVGAVIHQLGAQGMKALVRCLGDSPDGLKASLLITMARHMEKDASDAVPMLTQLLEKTDDPELALWIVQALDGIGPEAAPAIVQLLRCLLSEIEPLSSWSERALRNIGPDALPVIDEAIEEVSEPQSGILREARARLSPHSVSPAPCPQVKKPEIILSFLWIAEMAESSGNVSVNGVAKKIQREIANKQLPAEARRTGQTLLNHVDALQRALGGASLLERHSTKKSRITARGRAMLPVLRAQLEWLNSRR
jgi:hypothetical protein